MQLAAQTCPTIGAFEGPSSFCEGFPFTLTAIGLQNTSAVDNGEQDYDIDFVYLDSGSTDDPYTSGVSIGTDTPVDGEARLYEIGDDLPVGNYDIYAILSPAPADMACRPSQMISLALTICDDFGDFAFIDFNNNGTYDGDDVPLPQVSVYLYNADTDTENLDFGPMTTNVDGNFWYSVIPPGDYFLGFEPLAGYSAATTAANFGDLNNRIDPSAGNGALSTADFFFDATAADYTYDAGFIGPGTISGLVWADDNFDNLPNETGTNGVSFELDWSGPDGEWDTSDDVKISKTSAMGGAFSYPNLPYGEYQLSLIDISNTSLADGYDLVTPSGVSSYDFTIDADNTSFPEANFIFQPQCLPSTASLQTSDALVMCGNETLGIYADQIIRVALSDYVDPVSISEDYDYHILVVNEAGVIVRNYPILNPATGIAVNVDLTGMPIGDYGIHGLHYLTTDPDLAGGFDLSIDAAIQPILDRLTNIDGNTNPIITADVCGDISLTQNNLVAAMNPQPPVTLGCLGAVNVSLDSDCGATITPQMVLVGDWGCLIPSDFRIEIYQEGELISSDGQLSGCGIYTYEAHLLIDGIIGFPCWGTVNASDVSAPVLACPDDVTGGADPEGNIDFLCSDIDLLKLNVPSAYIVDGSGNIVDIDPALAAKLDVTGYPTILDGCDNVRVYVSDVIEENGDCGEMAILRTFFAEDKYDSVCNGSPNLSNICTQRITFRMPELDDLILPPNTIELDCTDFSGEDNPSPEAIADALDVLAYPAIFSFFDADPATNEFDPHLINQVFCTIGASYQDLARVNGCGNTYTFLREWTIYDKCDLSSFIDFNQLIKVKDTTPPALELPTVDYDQDGFPDIRRFSTAPYDCQAYIIPPDPVTLSDFCSGPPSLAITVTDMEGNFIFSGTQGQLFTVAPGSYNIEYCATDECDNKLCQTMPIIVRDDIEPTLICDDNLIVSLGGGDIANGQEGVARVFATNVDEGSNDNCSDITLQIRRNYWLNDDCGLSSNQYSPWGDDILFYCCDVGREVTIELMATDDVGNSNSCWLTVVPEDKLRPYCYAPADQTVSCADFPDMISGDLEDGYVNNFQATSIMMSSIFGAPTGTDNCSVDTLTERTPTININACGWGTITRRFEAWQLLEDGDANGNGVIDGNEVLRSINNCAQTITITETHEYLIEFPADAAADCLDPEIPGLVTDASGCDNLVINISEPQRFSATGDECYKLSITYDIINWCIWDGESDTYTVERQTDTDDSEVDPCERPIVRVDDNGAIIDRNHPESGCNSGLDNNFQVPANEDIGRWQYTQFVKVYDSSQPTFTVDAFGGPTDECPDLALGEFGSIDNTLCSAPIQINFSLDDACEVFDNNGNLVLSITDAHIDYSAVDANGDGQIDANEFNAEENVAGQISDLGDGSFNFSGTAPIIYLSQSTNLYHTLLIEAVDGCGNPAAQYISFRVLDCKAPAPICTNGLTVTLTPNAEGSCEGAVWTSDFLASPISDCSEPLAYAIYRESEVLAAGPDFVPNPVDTGLVLSLADEGTLAVYVYAIDSEGNFGFCDTYVEVQVSFSCIALGAIGGMVMTEEEEPVVGVRMSLSGPAPLVTYSEVDGSYLFDDLEEDFDYTVTAYRNDDPRNGVTTFDIVLISKHILALQPLNTPYKRIAADVNKSGTITTLDIIHIRKLILNITEEFPNNTSWRFIDQNYTFPQPDNPWVEFFPELINLNDLIGEELNAGFIGIKVGDVNGSANGSM